MPPVIKHQRMTVVAFVVFFFMVIVPGCSPGDRHATMTGSQMHGLTPTVAPTPDATDKAGSGLLEVEQFTVTQTDLRLNYRVTNIFPHDIWVCVNVNHLGNQDSRFSVETEICSEMLQIRRRANLEQTVHVEAVHIYAVYHRLRPGASRYDVVLLPLPVRDLSHVRWTGLPVNPVVLKYMVLEVGYFGKDLDNLISENEGSRRMHSNAFFKDLNAAFISFIEPYRWDSLHLEQFAQVTLSDVNVPGRIPAQEKD